MSLPKLNPGLTRDASIISGGVFSANPCAADVLTHDSSPGILLKDPLNLPLPPPL